MKQVNTERKKRKEKIVAIVCGGIFAVIVINTLYQKLTGKLDMKTPQEYEAILTANFISENEIKDVKTDVDNKTLTLHLATKGDEPNEKAELADEVRAKEIANKLANEFLAKREDLDKVELFFEGVGNVSLDRKKLNKDFVKNNFVIEVREAEDYKKILEKAYSDERIKEVTVDKENRKIQVNLAEPDGDIKVEKAKAMISQLSEHYLLKRSELKGFYFLIDNVGDIELKAEEASEVDKSDPNYEVMKENGLLGKYFKMELLDKKFMEH